MVGHREPPTFQLSAWKPAIPVTVAAGYHLDEKGLLAFPAFRNWLETFKKNLAVQRNSRGTTEKDPLRLTAVKIQNVTFFANGKISFMTIEASLKNNHTSLEESVFLRGGSVAILMVLRPRDSRNERYVILTEQPRIGACSTAFLEIPVGTLGDMSGNITGKAIQTIEEETCLRVRGEELIDLTAMALQKSQTKEHLQPALYMSPANLDEYMSLVLWEKELDRKEIEDLKGKLTGEHAKNELVTLRVRDYESLWTDGARDAKTLAAWALYEGLNRTGKIQARLQEIRTSTFKRW